MPQPALAIGTVERAKDLRQQGATLAAIASELGISQGSASNATRGIKAGRKPARKLRQEIPGREIGSQYEPGSTSKVLERIEPSERVTELANQVRESELAARQARAEAEVRRLHRAEEEESKRLEESEELRRRLKEAEVREVEMRSKSLGNASPEVLLQLEQSRSETQRLRDDLQEQRHREQLDEMRRSNATQLDLIYRAVKDQAGVGKSAYDVMGMAIDKVGSLLPMAVERLDDVGSSLLDMVTAQSAAQFGLTPGLYRRAISQKAPMSYIPTATLFAGENLKSRKQQGEALSEAEEAQLENYLAIREKVESDLVNARAALARGAGGSGVGGPDGKPVLVPGQSVQVMSAGTSIVNVECTHCKKLAQVDLLDRQAIKSGYGKCPNCGATMDLRKLTGKQAKTPDCPEFVSGPDGHCHAPAHRRNEPGFLCSECEYA
ncbi:hypothetical protein ES705_18591 [subsurface metagenome]